MRVFARAALASLVALALVACGGDAPAPEAASNAAVDTPAVAPAAALDIEALRERASASLAANRLYAPAGDNAVEDYLALRERAPGDAAVETALFDLAPYVIIGAEQATTARDFDEAERRVGLLARMDEAAPAVPRLRAALAAERALAASEAEAEALALAEREAAATQADERAAAERATRATPTPAAAPTPARAEVAVPAPAPLPPPAAPAPEPLAVAPPPPARPAAAPASTTPAAARALVSRVPARFPESALRRRLEGEVEVAVRIRPDGSVANVEVVRADPPGVFDREAVLAVRRWRYAEAATESETRVVLQFRRP